MKRPTGTWTRPIFKIDNPAGPKVFLTPGWYRDQRVWVVNYYAADREDAQNRGDIWLRKLFNDPKLKLRIPLWLYNFPYFPANLYTVNDVTSTLAVGSYSVQIVAENDLGQLTKPSAVTTISLPTTGKAIVVQIPREPKGWPIGYRFHVYLSGSLVVPTAAHRVGSIAYLVTSKVDPLFTIRQDVPNGTVQGAATALMAGLPAESEVRFRYMEVMPESIDTQMIEDPEVDGLFNYIVRFQTSTPGMREYPHPQAISSIETRVATEF